MDEKVRERQAQFVLREKTLGQILAFALHYGGKALIRWTRSAHSRDEDRRHKP